MLVPTASQLPCMLNRRRRKTRMWHRRSYMRLVFPLPSCSGNDVMPPFLDSRNTFHATPLLRCMPSLMFEHCFQATAVEDAHHCIARSYSQRPWQLHSLPAIMGVLQDAAQPLPADACLLLSMQRIFSR